MLISFRRSFILLLKSLCLANLSKHWYTAQVKIKFPLRSSKTLQSRFHVGKKMLNDFFKFSNLFFTHCSFYHTVLYCLLIYTRLTNCAEDLLLLHPLIARLSTETAAFVSFRLLRRQRVCFWMHSDVHFCFSSLSPSSVSPSFVVVRPGLSFAHFCFSRRRFHSVAYFAFLSPLSAS